MKSYLITASPLEPIKTPAFTGPVVRSALGLACRHLGCRNSCSGPCLDHRCSYTLAFDSGNCFRIDTTDLDHRQIEPTERWTARLVVFSDEHSDFLVDAFSLALARGLGHRRIGHRLLAVELEGEEEPIFGPQTVLLCSPTELKREGNFLPTPTVLDLLHATRHRLRLLNMPRPAPFEDNVEEQIINCDQQRMLRWTTRQGRLIELRGVQAAWWVNPTAAQATWLALAARIGLGKGTAMGKGVLRRIAVSTHQPPSFPSHEVVVWKYGYQVQHPFPPGQH